MKNSKQNKIPIKEKTVLKKKRKRKTQKGALIQGMSRKLPSEILGNPVFKKRLRDIMRNYSGIYALYKGNRV